MSGGYEVLCRTVEHILARPSTTEEDRTKNLFDSMYLMQHAKAVGLNAGVSPLQWKKQAEALGFGVMDFSYETKE